jgi:hypothetical protein
MACHRFVSTPYDIANISMYDRGRTIFCKIGTRGVGQVNNLPYPFIGGDQLCTQRARVRSG